MKKIDNDYMPQPELAVAFFNETIALVKSFDVYHQAYELAQQVYHTEASFKDEFDNYGKEFKLDPIDVVVANISYDMTMATMGCTTIVGEYEGKHWIGRNMDWFEPELVKKATYIRKHSWGRSVDVLGQVGTVTALSNHKFAIILNALPGSFNMAGKPVLLALRSILETAKSYQEAAEMITGTNFMSSGLITLVGENKGEIKVFELRLVPTRDVHREIKAYPQQIITVPKQIFPDYPIVVTNFDEGSQKLCPRHLRSKEMNPNFGNVIQTLDDEKVKQDITAQTILMDIGLNSLEVYV